ncbi:uncharacterized protein [Triticum aestivum]|uniref:uncharacterized protein n=1 Tax=Triticum aestivum TaxID=4565 RepID=UPI001D002492|nr:uncharacterized protein LOC123139939 [Triticum aestivum]
MAPSSTVSPSSNLTETSGSTLTVGGVQVLSDIVGLDALFFPDHSSGVASVDDDASVLGQGPIVGADGEVEETVVDNGDVGVELPVFSCEEETADFDPCMAHAVQVEACALEEGDHMSGTGPVGAGCEEDDAESPPCKRAKI